MYNRYISHKKPNHTIARMEAIAYILLAVISAAFTALAMRPQKLTDAQMKVLLDAGNDRSEKLLHELERRDRIISELTSQIDENRHEMLTLKTALMGAKIEIEVLKSVIHQHLGEDGLARIERTKSRVLAGEGKDAVIAAISDGNMERALALATGLAKTHDASNDIVALQGRYADLKGRIMAGTLANTDANNEKNAIRVALLEIISEME